MNEYNLLESQQDGFGLLFENCNDVIVEAVNENGMRNYYATGLFSEADVQLRNPRKYPKMLLEREIEKFRDKIRNGSSWGELEHPTNKKINPDRVCLIVKQLDWEGNKVIGKAQILENDMGKKYLSFLKAGKPGVSSRASGSVKNGQVQGDLDLVTWDGVLFPSANSVMDCLYESHLQKEFIENGILTEEQIYNFVKDIEKGKFNGFTKQDFNNAIINRFRNLIRK
jgi:hypothetical protein